MMHSLFDFTYKPNKEKVKSSVLHCWFLISSKFNGRELVHMKI